MKKVIIRNFKYGYRPHEEKVLEAVGKNPSILKRIKMGRMGSMKMRVLHLSDQLNLEFEGNNAHKFASIELRPKGIIVHLQKGIYRTAWLIPFYQLSIFKTDFWTIHGQGLKVQLYDEKWRNKDFIKKLQNKLSEYQALNQFPLN